MVLGIWYMQISPYTQFPHTQFPYTSYLKISKKLFLHRESVTCRDSVPPAAMLMLSI